MRDRYEPAEIEPKWQQRWTASKAFAVGDAGDDPTREKFYLLEMLPYPSGRIHMGHVRNYAIGDVLARQLRMRGKSVLHPMGWDAFGMPAENAAIERKRGPMEWTYSNIEQMRAQLQQLGYSYDWSREIATCDPSYYKHEQAMFLKMLERGLAYRKRAIANWCEHDQTVLANEQVEDGKCWRCGNPVVLKELLQWFIKTTAYAQELLDGHAKLDWPSSVITKQKNWIGRSEGAEIRFGFDQPVAGESTFSVFTTRPDTLYGVTFVSIAAEHPLAFELAKGMPREQEVRAFIERIRIDHRNKRDEGDLEKEGIFTGRYAIHPLTGAQVPIWIANFVLMDYGTGAVMAVPAHDERDFEFARKYGLELKLVIQPEGVPALDVATMTTAFAESGRLVGSGAHDGLPNEEAKAAITAELVSKSAGSGTISYRLRDWLVSRQRYWGSPIPVIHCPTHGVVPVPEKDLPVLLPEDVVITGEGGSPLARHEAFVNTTCPVCGGAARRETDTFDTFVESSWYFERYTTPREENRPVDPERARGWLPVDLYIGGEEHAVMHLIYARVWHYLMMDLGYLPKDTAREPFSKLVCQGMVCKEAFYSTDPHNPAHKIWCYPEDAELRDGQRVAKDSGFPLHSAGVVKMSKTKRNVVDPDEVVAKYGADAVRLFVLFAAPPAGQVDWSEEGLEGASRFLQRVWRMVRDRRDVLLATQPFAGGALEGAARDLRRMVHRTIDRVTRDLGDRMQPNTGIAAMMELVNALYAFKGERDVDRAVVREGVDALISLLSPFAPHIADEISAELGETGYLLGKGWPQLDASALIEDTIELPVQVNGKVRGRVVVAPDADEATVLAAARAEVNVAVYLDGKALKKTIYVPGRILTLVV